MGLLQINDLGSSFAIQAKEDDEYLKNVIFKDNISEYLFEGIVVVEDILDKKYV